MCISDMHEHCIKCPMQLEIPGSCLYYEIEVTDECMCCVETKYWLEKEGRLDDIESIKKMNKGQHYL